MTNARRTADHEKLAHRVARQIETEIVASGAAAGDNLGTEREIAARYGVGRNTLRQALTLVSRSGLAKVRRGAGGGLVVTTPEEGAVADALFNFLDVAPIDTSDLLEAFRQFENLAISLTIERQDAEASARLAGFPSRYDAALAQQTYPALATQCMEIVSAASRNPYLSLIRHTLAALLWSRLSPHLISADPERHAKMTDAYFRLAQAILAADIGLALSANAEIFDHLRAFTEARPDVTPGQADRDASPYGSDSSEKRGEAIARDIKQKIAQGHLKPGDRIGSESDLIAIYRTSREAMRDCARILEQWSIATTVRGKGGGLYVVMPAADSVLRTAGLYLRSVGIRRRSLAEVGNVLDLFVAETAARKVKLHATAALDLLMEQSPHADWHPRERALYHYHILNELADSRVVSLLVALHASLVEISPINPSADPARREREALFAAVAAGDPVRARNAMQAVRRRFTFGIPSASIFNTPAWQGLLTTQTLT